MRRCDWKRTKTCSAKSQWCETFTVRSQIFRREVSRDCDALDSLLLRLHSDITPLSFTSSHPVCLHSRDGSSCMHPLVTASATMSFVRCRGPPMDSAARTSRLIYRNHSHRARDSVSRTSRSMERAWYTWSHELWWNKETIQAQACQPIPLAYGGLYIPARPVVIHPSLEGHADFNDTCTYDTLSIVRVACHWQRATR